MLGTYPDARALPWTMPVRRGRVRRLGLRTNARQALVHGIRAAAKTACLSATLLAASGVMGAARAPVVLSEPSQPSAVQVAAPSLAAPYGVLVAAGGTRR